MGADFSDWAFRTQTAETFKNASFRLASNPGETEDDFKNRLRNVAREETAEEVDRLREKFAAKKAALEQKVLRAEQAKQREAEQAKGRKVQTAISFGATILSMFTGSKKLGSGTLGKATTTMRDVGRSIDQSGDVKRAEESLTAIRQRLVDLEAEEQTAIDEIEERHSAEAETLEKVLLRPRKSDITVDSLGLVWMPYWQNEDGSLISAWG